MSRYYLFLYCKFRTDSSIRIYSKLIILGLGEHAHFANFGMAFLTLFRVATGDNWNGIMKDTLREECDNTVDCVKNCCVSTVIAPIFFVIFVLMAQFVLVNVVVAVCIILNAIIQLFFWTFFYKLLFYRY